MTAKALIWTWNRLRPAEGWLTFLLLWTTVSCLMGAVVEAAWVAEGHVVIPAIIYGLILGTILAKRPLRTWHAWTLLLLYGGLLVTVYLARLLPPWSVIASGWIDYAQFNRQQMALFVDRWAGWVRAVTGGGSSRETIVFAFGLGLSAWLLAAYAGWSTFRQQQPLLGLTLIGLALAVNGYFGSAPIWYAVIFVATATLLTATLNYAYLEQGWERNQISYPAGIQVELVAAAGVVASLLLVLAVAVPGIQWRDLTRAFLAQPLVQQTEETLSRAFAGVRSPRQNAAALFSGAGILPNDFLIGNAPELANTIVMTATVSAGAPAGIHWRSLSYDVYNGQGWQVSTERQEGVNAGIPLPIPPISRAVTITQTVTWLFAQRSARYTRGLPRQFDQETTVYWRGANDLSQVRSTGSTRYTAISGASAASEAEWRQATLDAVPPVILGRYTQLPDSVPMRVAQLGQEIIAPYTTPYDQARAIEAFLRQYPYTLDVALPPRERDAVDYFLFDLQQGYCDYYASAMVVLARSVGLPARLAVGYMAQPPDEHGVETIVQLNAHSWAEVYFANFGWLEFEPTASFPLHQPPVPFGPGENTPPDFLTAPVPVTAPPIPPMDRGISAAWYLAGLLLVALVVGIGLWRRKTAHLSLDDVQAVYARLQRSAGKLGVSTPGSQTPLEFAGIFANHLQTFEKRPRLAGWAQMARAGAVQLAHIFMRHQYAPPTDSNAGAPAIWRQIRRPLWLLRLFRHTHKADPPSKTDES